MPHTPFDPTRNGYKFANVFDNSIKIPGVGNVAFAAGRCGGMAFTSLDYYFAGAAIPDTGTNPPGDNTSLGQFILQRQIASFFLPSAVKFFQWSALPDNPPPFIRPIADISRDQEFARITASIDANQPISLGLVAAQGLSIDQLGRNHQVVATGYDMQPGGVSSIFIYDVNFPGTENVIQVDAASNAFPERSASGSVVSTWRAFFVQDYYRQTPPVNITGIATGVAAAGAAAAEKTLLATADQPRKLRITFDHFTMSPGPEPSTTQLALRLSVSASMFRWPQRGYMTVAQGQTRPIGKSVDIEIAANESLIIAAQLDGRDYRHLSAFGIAPASAAMILDPSSSDTQRMHELSGSDNGRSFTVGFTIEPLGAG
ncbi:MAG: hypothetical protein M1434_10595 [Chloroflexi bacterium]|nr:hypothetical protein [Chloroflexota bacterium]MCL5275175.1 hypothetical protein [Chloroflexota bacterium]